MTIDMHAHTSDHAMRGLHTSDASLDALAEQMQQYGIERTMIMATYFPFKGTGLSNMTLLERVRGRKQFLVFGSLDAMNHLDEGTRELATLADAGALAGIKLYPGYQDFSLSDDRLTPVFEIARKHRLPVAVHTGELHHCCPKEARARGEGRCGMICPLDLLADRARPHAVLDAALRFPDVTFICCHLGNPFFDEMREVMRRAPNVFADISGQYVSGTDDANAQEQLKTRIELLKFLDVPRGSERLLFGTDFPIQSHADSFALVEDLGLSDAVKHAIYHQNAHQLLAARR